MENSAYSTRQSVQPCVDSRKRLSSSVSVDKRLTPEKSYGTARLQKQVKDLSLWDKLARYQSLLDQKKADLERERGREQRQSYKV